MHLWQRDLVVTFMKFDFIFFMANAYSVIPILNTEYEQVLIIWGGPLAQLMLLLLSSVILFAYGYSPYSFYNIMLVIFVYYNFANVLFNLMPISWLDGGTAWKIIPMLIKKRS